MMNHPTRPADPVAGLSASPKSFYRRPLPDSAVAFSSPEGRRRFASGLASGTLECYFPLAEQFTTQNEPAFCGLGTLTCVLNALQIDPGRTWKGPWRWFSDDMLDCCEPLDVIKKNGITLEQLACLARCNGATVSLRRPNLIGGGAKGTRTAADGADGESASTSAASRLVTPSSSLSSSSSSSLGYKGYGGTLATLEDFREALMSSCRGDGTFVILSYTRRRLGQTGQGRRIRTTN